MHEQVLDSFPRSCGCLIVNHIILLGQFVSHAERYLFLAVVYITLVSCHGEDKLTPVIIAVLFHFADPVVNRLESIFRTYVKAIEGGVSISIVHAQHRPELLLASSVPYVQLYLAHFGASIWHGLITGIGHAHHFLKVCPSDCVLINVLEISVIKPAS